MARGQDGGSTVPGRRGNACEPGRGPRLLLGLFHLIPLSPLAWDCDQGVVSGALTWALPRAPHSKVSLALCLGL